MAERKKVLIHLGQPKAWSTSIQGCFEGTADTNYLGYYPSFPDRRWYRAGVGEVLEFGVRFETKRSFARNLKRYQDIFRESLSSKRCNVVSCEALSFKCYPSENDTRDKLQRLRQVTVDTDLTFLYVWRRPEFILRSLYKELVRLGISHNFEEFLQETYRHRFFNFCDDLCGKEILKDLKRTFDNSPIWALTISEDAEKDSDGLHDLLRTLLGDAVPRPLHCNRSLDSSVLAALLHLNRANPRLRSFGNLVEHHRIFPEAATDDDSWVWANARNRRAAVAEAIQLAQKKEICGESFMNGARAAEYIFKISEGKSPPN